VPRRATLAPALRTRASTTLPKLPSPISFRTSNLSSRAIALTECDDPRWVRSCPTVMANRSIASIGESLIRTRFTPPNYQGGFELDAVDASQLYRRRRRGRSAVSKRAPRESHTRLPEHSGNRKAERATVANRKSGEMCQDGSRRAQLRRFNFCSYLRRNGQQGRGRFSAAEWSRGLIEIKRSGRDFSPR
jgi:hypothetical protein